MQKPQRMLSDGNLRVASTVSSSRSFAQAQGQAHALLDSSHAFRQVLKDLTAFREEGVISDEQLERLLIYVCGLFVEQEVGRRFHTILDRAFSADRILKVLT